MKYYNISSGGTKFESLSNICLAKIVKNFENKPEIPEDIPDIVKDMIYDKLPIDLKFEKAAK